MKANELNEANNKILLFSRADERRSISTQEQYDATLESELLSGEEYDVGLTEVDAIASIAPVEEAIGHTNPEIETDVGQGDFLNDEEYDVGYDEVDTIESIEVAQTTATDAEDSQGIAQDPLGEEITGPSVSSIDTDGMHANFSKIEVVDDTSTSTSTMAKEVKEEPFVLETMRVSLPLDITNESDCMIVSSYYMYDAECDNTDDN